MDNLKKSPEKPLIPPTDNKPLIIGNAPVPALNDDSYIIVDDTVNKYIFIHPFNAKIQTANVLTSKTFDQDQIIEGREVTLKGDSKQNYIRYQMPPDADSGDMHTNIYIDESYLKKCDTPKSTATEKSNAMYVLFGFILFVTILGILLLNKSPK